MALIKLTRELAYAAGVGAGNRAMRAAGRKVWNEGDYYAAAREFTRLWPNCPPRLRTPKLLHLL
jgi:hypothetical protein